MSKKARVVTREELFERVWEKPAYQVAEKFEISPVELGKICKRMNIFKPPRGYWAKLEAGKQQPKPDIPKLTEDGVSEITITPNTALSRDRQPAEVISVSTSLTDPHPYSSIRRRSSPVTRSAVASMPDRSS